MSKYLVTGGYTAEAWASMIENPTSRAAAAQKIAEAVGGKLDSFYWSFGEDDFLAILDAPDDVAAGALSVVVGSSGALRNVRTTKLITGEESRKLLEKAKASRAQYVPPTAKQPAGVR
jgi:uncharacterized protein with GYD domain